jgi:hypothetical protein
MMGRSCNRPLGGAGALFAALCLASSAMAGPPYITDDPIPTDTHHWEIYTYTDNSFSHHDHEGEAGLDMNYGLAKNTQLTAVVAGAYAGDDGHGLRVADTELGVKYAFVHDEAGGLHVSFFPALVLPTAPGGGRVAYELPIWAQKDFGKWSVFGGGGPTIRSGQGARTSWEQGIALTRQIGEGFSLGIEVAHSGAEEVGEHGATTAQLGTTIHLFGGLSFLAAAGPAIEDHTARTGAHVYAAILTNF